MNIIAVSPNKKIQKKGEVLNYQFDINDKNIEKRPLEYLITGDSFLDNNYKIKRAQGILIFDLNGDLYLFSNSSEELQAKGIKGKNSIVESFNPECESVIFGAKSIEDIAFDSLYKGAVSKCTELGLDSQSYELEETHKVFTSEISTLAEFIFIVKLKDENLLTEGIGFFPTNDIMKLSETDQLSKRMIKELYTKKKKFFLF